jgi:DNA helicase-2/ATP-dependent DNA helicase PcrA
LSSIDSYIEQLNDKQKEAVLENSAPLLVLAGAGSGKTRVITTKIAYAIDRLGISPYEILAVTFTNKAAREMKERVTAMLPEVDVSKMHIRTFHSFGAWLLRVYGSHIRLSNNFSIYDDEDSLSLLSGIYPSSKKVELKPIAKSISLAKDMMLPVDSNDLDRVRRGIDFPKQYAAYEKRLREVGNVDFADLISRSIELLSPQLPVAATLHNRFKMILVDEYQDSNIAQFQLLKALVGPHTFICVVGDDDQSIYRFRGANVEHILTFPDVYPGTKIVKLEQNYRSTEGILKVATSVISHNKGRHEKVLWTDKKGGNNPTVLYVEDDKSEALRVAKEIKKDKQYDSTAVIYRTNAQSLAFETLFQKEKIPYKVIGALKFYDREEIKDALSLIYIMLNRFDEVHFKRMINKPARSLGQVSVDKIIAVAEQEHIDLIEATRRAASNGVLSGKAASSALQFALLFDEALNLIDKGNSRIVEYLVRESTLVSYYHNQDAKNETGKVDNIGKLVSTVDDYEAGIEGLLQFVESLSLDPTTLGNEDPSKKEGVSLITMHNTKGLEFDRVFVTGLEENLFPSSSCESDEDFEEERRLFYVAVTRARKELFITSCARRMVFGRTNYQMPSRYLQEIPKDLLTIEGRGFNNSPRSSASFDRGYQGHGSLGQKREKSNSNIFVSTGKGNILNSVRKFVNAPKEDTTTQSVEYKVGMKVYHDQYGEGFVQHVKTMKGKVMVEVVFNSSKVATFFAFSRVLEIIS